jgi:GTP:adenosylcobinamide-phosphate guanylyltransferase
MAGAPAGAELSPENPCISRAMIPLGSKTMLQWIVDALRSASSVGRIVAVGEVSADGLDEVVAPGDDLVGNMKLGLGAVGPADAVLIVCSDVPLLTSEAVDDFVTRAVSLGVDMAYPIIRQEDCARHPELKRTYLKTGDGVFTGGNIMLLRPEFVERNWKAIQESYAARKQIGKLARMIGVGVLIRVIVAQAFPGVLKVAALERAASRMLGGRVAAVVSRYPEIGEDVDKPSDLAAVRGILCPDNAE